MEPIRASATVRSALTTTLATSICSGTSTRSSQRLAPPLVARHLRSCSRCLAPRMMPGTSARRLAPPLEAWYRVLSPQLVASSSPLECSPHALAPTVSRLSYRLALSPRALAASALCGCTLRVAWYSEPPCWDHRPHTCGHLPSFTAVVLVVVSLAAWWRGGVVA